MLQGFFLYCALETNEQLLKGCLSKKSGARHIKQRPERVVLPIPIKVASALVIVRFNCVIQKLQQQQKALITDIGNALVMGQDIAH